MKKMLPGRSPKPIRSITPSMLMCITKLEPILGSKNTPAENTYTARFCNTMPGVATANGNTLLREYRSNPYPHDLKSQT